MIQITVDMTKATADEIENFYALPGVGRALDALVLSQWRGVQLRLLQPARLIADPPPDSDSAHLARVTH